MPFHERERRDVVRHALLADDDRFDAVCRTARALFDVPVAQVCLSADDETGQHDRFCGHARHSDEPLVVPDASRDQRFADDPLVVGMAGRRFYAGVPLVLDSGFRIGTISVADTRPRDFPPERVEQLRDLAAIVVAQVRLGRPRTPREHFDGAMTQSETRYRSLADALPQMVWIMRGLDGEALYANRPFRDYYGEIGPGLAERTARHHLDDAARIKRAWTESSGEGRVFEVEGRLRRHDGLYRWHRLVMIPVRRDGAVAEWFGTALDIDEMVRANASLRDTTAMLRLAQDAAGAGLWEWDLGSNEAHLSSQSAKLQGFACESEDGILVAAEQWTANLHPDDAASVWSWNPETMAATSFSSEYRVRSGGEAPDVYRWIQSFGRVLADAEGRPSRVVGLDLDVTERKRAEAAIELARREAERASAAKTEFLAAMSHEMRTPLNGILGYADLLLADGGLPPTQALQIARIQDAGQALLTVVDDILDFAKVEAGRIALDPAPFSPRSLVEGAVAMVAGIAGQKGLALSVRFAGACPERVVGDRNRLRQVLLALLNNAVKFTAQGSVTLIVACEAEPGALGCSLGIAVTDTGIGIPAERHGQLFRRFSQLDASISRHYGGSGLGLAISQHLVALMGGRIAVESVPGAGSTFHFAVTLPVAERPGEPAIPGDAVPAGRLTGRILVVDDVAINRDIAQAVLQADGHAVDAVSGGAEAIAAVQAQAYDLVLMDVQMPEIDGMAATRFIRALPSPAARVPVIALTANVLPDQVAAFRAAGMDAHLGKPFKREALLAAVAFWLSEARSETVG